MILIFGQIGSEQTVQTQIRLLAKRSSLIWVFTVSYSICIILAKYPKFWLLLLNFRYITAKIFLAFRNFRNFTVFFAMEKMFQDAITLCTLGPGTSFGESVLTNRPRHSTVITRDYTELIRVEQKDFKILWEVKFIVLEQIIE